MQWRCDIAITPQAKQSVAGGKGKFYTPTRKRAYVDALRTYIMGSPPSRLLVGPVRLSVTFIWPYRKSTAKRDRGGLIDKVTRPDMDNLLKPLKDAMSGVVYHDDSEVSRYGCVEKYHGPQAKIRVLVEELANA